MARPLKPLIRGGGGFYPSKRLTPLVYQGGYTTPDGGGESGDPLNTFTGKIVQFFASAVKPIVELAANLVPSQDLHGYDNPWPAGGGANQWDEEWELGGINSTTGAFEPASDRIRSKNYIPAFANTTYYVSTTEYLNNIRVYYYTENKTFISHSGWLSGNNILTPANTAYMAFILYGKTTYSNNIAINLPSAVTTYSPYSNICPISGHTGVTVNQRGSNLVGGLEFGKCFENCNGYSLNTTNKTFTFVRSNSSPYQNAFPFKESTRYTIMITYTSENANNCISLNYADGTFDAAQDLPASPTKTTVLLKTNASKTFAYLGCGWRNSTGTVTVYYEESGVFEGDLTAADFETYNGNTYPISWSTIAGTVYSGTLTVNEDGTGQIVVDQQNFDGGSLTWTKNTGSNFRNFTAPPSVKIKYNSTISTVKSSMYKSTSNDGASSTDDCYVWVRSLNPNNLIAVKDTAKAVMTAEEFKTAMTGVDFVCVLETPVTTPLTAEQVGQIITTLYGDNNVWADTGNVSLDYRADTKLYIEKLTQPTEDDMIANTNIASGKFFMVGNNLYLSTASIANGAAIVPGTNCTALSLADALNSL